MSDKYLLLKDLSLYRSSVELSDNCWEIYDDLNWNNKKIIGSQFIRSIDSIGANVAEGYGRYHYLDRIKFYYNARGSLLESKHWVLLLRKRNMILQDKYDNLINKLNNLHRELNTFIKSCRPKK